MNILLFCIDCISLGLFAYGLSTGAITSIVDSALTPVWISIVLIAQLIFFLSVYRYFFSSSFFRRAQEFRLERPMVWRGAMIVGWIYAFFEVITMIVFIFGNDVFTDSASVLVTTYISVGCILMSAIAIGFIGAVHADSDEKSAIPYWMYALASVMFFVPAFLLALREKRISMPTKEGFIPNRLSAITSIAYNFILLNGVAFYFSIAQDADSYTFVEALERFVIIVILLYLPYYFLRNSISVRVHRGQYIWDGVYFLAQVALVIIYV